MSRHDVARAMSTEEEGNAYRTAQRLRPMCTETMTAGDFAAVVRHVCDEIDVLLPAREGDVRRARARLYVLEYWIEGIYHIPPSMGALLCAKICEWRDAISLCERAEYLRSLSPWRESVVDEVDTLCSTHVDVDQIKLCKLPSRPPKNAPLRTLIAYLVRRWWRRLWR